MESVSSHFEEEGMHEDDALTEHSEALRRLDERLVNAKNACIETEQLHERGFLVYRLQKQRLKYAKYHLRKLELLKTQATSGILTVSGGTIVSRSSKEAPLRLLGSGAYKELKESLKTGASDGSHSHSDDLAEFRRKFVEHSFTGAELGNATVATPRKLRRSIRASKGTTENCDTLDHARRFLTDSLARGIFMGCDPLDFDDETNATSTVREVLLLGQGAEGHSVDAIIERQEFIKDVRQITDEHIKFVHEHNHRFRLETVLNIAAETCTTTEHHHTGGASETLLKHVFYEGAALSGRSSSTSGTESDSSSDAETTKLDFEVLRRRGEGKGSADHHYHHHHRDQHHHAKADVRLLGRKADLDSYVFEVDRDIKELHEDMAKHVTVEVEETTHRTRRKLKGAEQDETSRKSSSSSSCEDEFDDHHRHSHHDEHRHAKAVEHEVQLLKPFPDLPAHPIHAVPTDEKTLVEDVHRTIYLDVEETTHRSRSPRRRSAEEDHVEEVHIALKDLHYSHDLDRVHFHVNRIVSEELDSLDRSTTISLDETDDVFLSCDEATPEPWRDERTPEPIEEHKHTGYWTPASDEEASHRTPVSGPLHDHFHPCYRHHPHKDFFEEMLDVNLRLTCHLLYRTLDIPEIPYRHYRPRYSHIHEHPSPTEEPHHVHVDIHLAEPRSVGAEWRETDTLSLRDAEMPHRKHSNISIVEEPIMSYATSYRPPTPVVDIHLAERPIKEVTFDLTLAYELPPIPLSYVLEVAVGIHTSVTVDTTYCIDEELIEHTHHVRAPLERLLSHSSSEETTSTVIELYDLVPYQALPWTPFEPVVHMHAALGSPDFEVQEKIMRFSPEEPLYYEIANTESRQSHYTDVEDHEDHAKRILLDNAINETQERTEDVHFYDEVPHEEIRHEHHYDEVPYEVTVHADDTLHDLHRWNEMDRHPLECRPPVEIYVEVVAKQRVYAMQDLIRTQDAPFIALTVKPVYETSYELEAKLLQEVLQGPGAERHPSEPLEPRKLSESERTRSKTIPEVLRSAIKSAIHPLMPHRHRHKADSHMETPLRDLRRAAEMRQLSLLISPDLPDFGKRVVYQVPVVDIRPVEDEHQRHNYSDDSFDDDHVHVYDVVHHETVHLGKTGEMEYSAFTLEKHEPIYDNVPFVDEVHHHHHGHHDAHHHDYDIIPPAEPVYDVPEDKEPASFEPEEVVHSISPEADMEQTPLHVHAEPLPAVVVHEHLHEEVADNERIIEDLQKSADALDGTHYEEHVYEPVAQDVECLAPLQDISPARELPVERFIVVLPEVLHESDLETFTSEENIYASIPDEDIYAVPKEYPDVHDHEDVKYEEPYEPHYDYPPEEHHYYSPPEWHMDYELHRVRELDEHDDRREQWYHRDEVRHIHLDFQYADVEVAHEPLYHFSLPPLWREELPVCKNIHPVEIFNGLHEMVTISDFRNISGLPHELELRYSKMRRTSDYRIVSEQLQTSSEDSAFLYRSRRSSRELTLLQRLFRHRKLPDYIPSSPVLLCNASEVPLASPLSLYFHLLNYYIHRNQWEAPYFLTAKDPELSAQPWPERLHHAPSKIREATESMLRASEGNRITVGILLRSKNLWRPSSAPVGDNRVFSPAREATLNLTRSRSEEDFFLFDDEHVARIHEHCDWTNHIGATRRRMFDEPCSTEFSEEELWRHIYDAYEKVEMPQELREAEERFLLRKTPRWHARSEESKHQLKYVVVRSGHDESAVPPLPTSPIPEIPKLDEYEKRFSWDNELSSPGARYVVQARKFIPPKSPTESPVHSPTRHAYIEKVHRTSGALHIERLTPASDTTVRSSEHKDTVEEVIPTNSHSHASHRTSEAMHATNVSAVAEKTIRSAKLSEVGKGHRKLEALQHVEKETPVFEVPGRASVFADTDKGATPTSPPSQGSVPTLSAKDVKLSPFGKRKLIPGLKEYKKYGLELSDDEEFVIPGDGRVSTEPQPKHTKLDTTASRQREEAAPPKSKHWTSRAASGEEQRLPRDIPLPVSKRASVTERKVFSPPPAAEDFRFSAAFQRIHKSAEQRFTEKDAPKEDIVDPVKVEHHDQVVPKLRHVEPSERTLKQETTHEFPVKPRLRHVDRKRRTTEELASERASAKLARVSAELQAEDGAKKAAAFKFITRFAEPPSLFKAVRHYSRMPDLQDGFPVDHLVDGMLNGGEENDASRKWDPTSLLEELYKIDYNPLVEKRNRFRSMEGHVEVPNDEVITAPGIEKEWKKQYFRVRDARLQWFATHGADEHPAGDVLLTGTTVTANRAEWSIEVKGGKENADIHMRIPSNVFDKWYQAIMSHSHASLIDAYVQPAPPPVPHYTQRVVLIELGTSSIRAGVLTNKPSLPQVFFPSVGCVTETGEVFVGTDALKPEIRHLGHLQRPIDATDSSVERYRLNRPVLTGCIHKVLADLRINPSQYKVLLSIPQNIPTTFIGDLMRVLLNENGFQAASIARQPSLILYSYDVTTGVVVDIGERLNIVPVIDEYIVESAIVSLPFGAQQIRDNLRQKLNGRNNAVSAFRTPVEQVVLRYLAEQTCYVATDYDEESRTAANSEKTVDLSKYHIGPGMDSNFTIDSSRFHATEGLFKPKKWGHEVKGVHQLIYDAIQLCPIDSRRTLFRNIYLSGGTSLLPGFAERLETELSNLAPNSMFVQVHGSPWRYHAAFLGAQVITNSYQFEKCCADKSNLEEYVRQVESSLS